MMLHVLVIAAVAMTSVIAEPPLYPQVRFQPLQNIVVLPFSEQLSQTPENATKQQDPKPKGIKPKESRAVTMQELKAVEGAVSGSYHVLLQNGQLQRVDYTAAPRLPVKEQVQLEPEIKSWYYTQLPADVLQRYYAEYYAQQQNSELRKPGSTNQTSNSNSQEFSQTAGHGTNQVSNNNNQVLNQGKKGAFIVGSFDAEASRRNGQSSEVAITSGQSAAKQIPASSNQNAQFATHFRAQQSTRSNDEVETF